VIARPIQLVDEPAAAGSIAELGVARCTTGMFVLVLEVAAGSRMLRCCCLTLCCLQASRTKILTLQRVSIAW